MARFFFTLAYDGTAFIGWQRQPKGRSVQGVIEEALKKICGQDIALVGSGRTDAGVHAQAQVAHAELPYAADALPPNTLRRLNLILPFDIVAKEVYPVDPRMHARFSAKWREYRYFCTLDKLPFTQAFCTRLRMSSLNVDAMQQAASYLLGEHNFRSFSKAVPTEEHFLCQVMEARWEWTHGHLLDSDARILCFTIRANRFLRGQIRALVGAMLEVGKGARPPEWIADVLALQSVLMQAPLAHAEGLHLYRVGYSALD